MSPSPGEIDKDRSDTSRSRRLEQLRTSYNSTDTRIMRILSYAGAAGSGNIGDLRPVGFIAQFDPETNGLTHLHPVVQIENPSSNLSSRYTRGALLVTAGTDFEHLFLLNPATPAATDSPENTAAEEYEIRWTNNPELNHVRAQTTLFPKDPKSNLVFCRTDGMNIFWQVTRMARELADSLSPTSDDLELDTANRTLSAIRHIETALMRALSNE